MIKCLIFDLDNTLIKWKSEYVFALVNTFKKLNICYDNELINKVDLALLMYEDNYDIYKYNLFVDFINKRCNLNLPLKFVHILIKEQGNCYEKLDEEVISTLDYLSKKYDLIVLSNWFTDTQKLRLKGTKILKYFKYVSGGDERKLKPSKHAFNFILKEYKKEECIMIGDSIKTDINGAMNAGIKSILLTDKKYKSKKFKCIKSLIELKEML